LIRKFIVDKNEFAWDLTTLDLIAGVDLSASKDHPDYACVALIVYSIKTKAVIFEDCRII
jgi:deoxyinosine 3'endonuclease (endonuclease V)